MKRLLTLLLLAAGTAYGQIDNPPSSVNIVDSTATGRAVLTATNPAAAATAIGLGTTNLAAFTGLEIFDGDELQISSSSISSVTFGGRWEFDTQTFFQGASEVFAYSTNSFTVTGNAILNGVANLAPEQTADSSDSLMTRGLVDQRQIDRMIAGPRMVWLTTFTGYATQVSGGSVLQSVLLRASSGTNAFDYAVARNFQSGKLFAGPGDQLDFSKAGSFGTAYFSPGANFRDGTDIIYYGGAFNYVPSSGSAVVDPATKGFGWKVKDESIIATMFGTNYVEVATNSVVLSAVGTTRQNVWLFIKWDGTGDAAWYINGSEIATTTNGATGLTSVNQGYIIFGTVADVALTQQNQNSISAFLLDREP